MGTAALPLQARGRSLTAHQLSVPSDLSKNNGETWHQYQETTLALLTHTDEPSTRTHACSGVRRTGPQCVGENCSLWVYDVSPCVFGTHIGSTVHNMTHHPQSDSITQLPLLTLFTGSTRVSVPCLFEGLKFTYTHACTWAL